MTALILSNAFRVYNREANFVLDRVGGLKAVGKRNMVVSLHNKVDSLHNKVVSLHNKVDSLQSCKVTSLT